MTGAKEYITSLWTSLNTSYVSKKMLEKKTSVGIYNIRKLKAELSIIKTARCNFDADHV